MAERSDTVPRTELTLGPGTEFDGLVLLHGPARIEGRIRGEIRSEDRVWLGAESRVEGRVQAEELRVEGAVEGDLRARRRIALGATARVRGSVASPRLRLEDGSQLEGRCASGPRAQDLDSPPSSA